GMGLRRPRCRLRCRPTATSWDDHPPEHTRLPMVVRHGRLPHLPLPDDAGAVLVKRTGLTVPRLPLRVARHRIPGGILPALRPPERARAVRRPHVVASPVSLSAVIDVAVLVGPQDVLTELPRVDRP